jgi:hypothetical protein
MVNKGNPKIDKNNEYWAKITEDDLWVFVTRSVTRCFHDVIATHEAHDSQFVPVPWLRDYADDLAINFPRIRPDMIMRKKPLEDTDFE